MMAAISTQERAELVATVVAEHAAQRGPLLPVLHELQGHLGCIDSETVGLVAAGLNLSRADVHGVVTFYPDLRSESGGRHAVRVCRGEACQSVGAADLARDAEAIFGVALGATTLDGAVTLEQVFCLGNCALGPSAQVDGRTYGRVDGARLRQLVAGEPA